MRSTLSRENKTRNRTSHISRLNVLKSRDARDVKMSMQNIACRLLMIISMSQNNDSNRISCGRCRIPCALGRVCVCAKQRASHRAKKHYIRRPVHTPDRIRARDRDDYLVAETRQLRAYTCRSDVEAVIRSRSSVSLGVIITDMGRISRAISYAICDHY